MDAKKLHKRPTLTEHEFKRLSEFIKKSYGINLTDNKKDLLEYRLSKRLAALRMVTYSSYLDYLFSAEGMEKESALMINEVSTNKTEFFREKQHFDILNQHILPIIAPQYAGISMPIWSAGCSSGEEVYSLALTMERFRASSPAFSYHILGTDISSTILQTAYRGIYSMDSVKEMPQADLRKYFLKNREESRPEVRLIKMIRDKVAFKHLNLMDAIYDTPVKYPIIFCRNTLIYFDRETKAEIIRKMKLRLLSGGYLFISHTESLVNLNQGLSLVYPSVYQKTE